MNAFPARVAGVKRLVVTVPTPYGVANPLVLLACRLAGVDEVFRIGGLVEAGSVVRGQGETVSFRVTDGAATVPVTYTGLLPDLFTECEASVA